MITSMGPLLTTLLLISRAQAGLKLTDLSVEHLYSVGTNRHWAIPEGERKKGEIKLHMRHDSKYLYSRSRIGMMYTNAQFRYGCLEYEVGGKAGDVGVFLHHLSEHTLDFNIGKDYHNSNSIGVRIQLK